MRCTFDDPRAAFVDAALLVQHRKFIEGLALRGHSQHTAIRFEIVGGGGPGKQPEQEMRREVGAMNVKRKLLNPFVLIGQGFVAGAVLFFSTAPEPPAAQPLTAGVQSAAVQQIAGI